MRFLCLLLSCAFLSAPLSAAEKKPNVLMIAIDDQNDWIGYLGGHPRGRRLGHAVVPGDVRESLSIVRNLVPESLALLDFCLIDVHGKVAREILV